jgi:hypothetical protein
LTIASSSATSTATFGSAVPDNVGVGDAIQYDRDNNGSIDSIAFINYRYSSTVFGVTKYDGTPATSTTAADADWAIYRAYTSLANAESGTENANLNDTIEQFDASWSDSGNKNIASSSEQWNIACYANGTGADTEYAGFDWTTSLANYLKVYTPFSINEVGSSQRNQGKWDNNKYHISKGGSLSETAIGISSTFFRVEGLQISASTTDSGQNAAGIMAWGSLKAGDAGDIRISSNIIQCSNSVGDGYGIAAVADYQTIFKIYNNIIYDCDFDGVSTWDTDVLFYAYANTVFNTRVAFEFAGTAGYAKNNITQDCSVDACFVGAFSNISDYNLNQRVYNVTTYQQIRDILGTGTTQDSIVINLMNDITISTSLPITPKNVIFRGNKFILGSTNLLIYGSVAGTYNITFENTFDLGNYEANIILGNS